MCQLNEIVSVIHFTSMVSMFWLIDVLLFSSWLVTQVRCLAVRNTMVHDYNFLPQNTSLMLENCTLFLSIKAKKVRADLFKDLIDSAND